MPVRKTEPVFKTTDGEEFKEEEAANRHQAYSHDRFQVTALGEKTVIEIAVEFGAYKCFCTISDLYKDHRKAKAALLVKQEEALKLIHADHAKLRSEVEQYRADGKI